MDQINPVAGNPETLTAPFPPRSNNVAIVALSISTILLLGGTIFLAYQNMQLQKQIAAYQSQQVSIPPLPVNTDTANLTTTWKTYVNTTYGYSLQYPRTVSKLICENEENQLYLLSPAQPESTTAQNCARDSRFSLEVYASKEPIMIKNRDGYDMTTENTVVNGIEAKKYISTRQPNAEGPGESWLVNIVFSKNGVYYEAYTGQKELFETLTQILSTFRFLEPQPSTMTPTSPNKTPQACTAEAKICPDGSAVERSGPNCEFTPCP